MKFLNCGISGAVAVLVAVGAGCYNYQRPPVATLGNSYTERQRDAADELLKGKKSLTLRDAQRIALKNNPNYISAYHAVEAARMRYYQALGAYSPTVTAGYSISNSDAWRTTYHAKGKDPSPHSPRTGKFGTSLGIEANWMLFDGFARYFRMKAAQSSRKYSQLMEEDACRTMMQAVSTAYNAVLLAVEQRRIAEADRKFQLDTLQNTKNKFEAGAAPLSDVLNFEILASNADVNLIAADYAYEVAVYALAVLMGYPDGTLPADMKFDGDFKEHSAELPAVEVFLNIALNNRPDLKAYREELNIAKYQVYQAWGAFSPTVNAYISYGLSTGASQDHDSSDRHTYAVDMNFGYGVEATWTIFNGAIRYNKLREAQASMAIADYSVAAQWFKVIDEVRNAYANYNQNVKKTQLYIKIRNLSAKQRDLVNEEYRAGHAELTRLNEAQRDLVEAESNLASSFINIQNARAQLIAVVGGDGADFYLNKENDGLFTNILSKPQAPAAAPAGVPAESKKQLGTKPVEKGSVIPAVKRSSAAPAIPESATAPAKR